MDIGSIVPKTTKLQIQIAWDQGNQMEVGLEAFAVCANIFKTKLGKFEVCSVQSRKWSKKGVLMSQEWKQTWKTSAP